MKSSLAMLCPRTAFWEASNPVLIWASYGATFTSHLTRAFYDTADACLLPSQGSVVTLRQPLHKDTLPGKLKHAPLAVQREAEAE